MPVLSKILYGIVLGVGVQRREEGVGEGSLSSTSFVIIPFQIHEYNYCLLCNVNMIDCNYGSECFLLQIRFFPQAVRVNTISKLTFLDSVRFDALVKDIFPGTAVSDIQYPQLTDALREAYKDLNLIYSDLQVCEHGCSSFFCHHPMRLA